MWMDNAQPYSTADPYQGYDTSDWANYTSWWTGQAPEPQQEPKPKRMKETELYSQSAEHGFYAGPTKKRQDTYYGGVAFAAYEHPIDVVSNTVQYSFTTKDEIPNLHPPADYLSFSAAERLNDLEENPCYVIADTG